MNPKNDRYQITGSGRRVIMVGHAEILVIIRESFLRLNIDSRYERYNLKTERLLDEIE